MDDDITLILVMVLVSAFGTFLSRLRDEVEAQLYGVGSAGRNGGR